MNFSLFAASIGRGGAARAAGPLGADRVVDIGSVSQHASYPEPTTVD